MVHEFACLSFALLIDTYSIGPVGHFTFAVWGDTCTPHALSVLSPSLVLDQCVHHIGIDCNSLPVHYPFS